MNAPDYFMSFQTPWDQWVSVKEIHEGFFFSCTANGVVVNRSKEAIEKKYPGFATTYNLLLVQGCDEYFTTDVLKFCITNAQDRLDTYLYASDMLKEIPNALALGMSGHEFVLLRQQAHILQDTPVLPENISEYSSSNSLKVS